MTSLQSRGKPISLEKFREAWQRELTLHRDVPASVLKVAMVLCWHINRESRMAFPGMRTIGKLASLSTSTVNKAVHWLETRGYLKIKRGKTRHSSNRYLPLLRGANRVFALGRTQCSLQSATEPLSEPLKEPLSYKASISIDAVLEDNSPEKKEGREGDFRDSKVHLPPSISTSPSKPAESPVAQCYRIARRICGGRGSALVTKALRSGSIDDVLAVVIEAEESGEDLGFVLAEFWKDEWRSF